MTNVPKRQKTLLGYFALYESGESVQCLSGHIRQPRAQDSNAGATILTDPCTQRAGTSGHAILADSMRHKPSAVPIDNRDGALPIKAVIGPVSQLATDTAQCSETTCSVRQSCTAADSMERSTASEDDNEDGNQYEQQVSQPQVDWLARALHHSC